MGEKSMDSVIRIDERQVSNAMKDADGVMIMRGKDADGKTLFVALKAGRMVWASSPTQAKREVLRA